MLEVFSSTGEMYHARFSLGTCEPPAHFLGRGRVNHHSKTLTPPHSSPHEGALNTYQVRLGKLTRRVEELIRKLTLRHAIEPVPQEWSHMWTKCRTEGKVLSPECGQFWQEHNLPDIGSLRRLSFLLRNRLEGDVGKCREERRRMWHEQFMADFKSTRVQTFEFIRGRPPRAIPLLQREDGSMTGDYSEIDAMLHGAWEEVFSPTDAEPSVEDFPEIRRIHPTTNTHAQRVV